MKWTFLHDHIIASLFALSALMALILALIFGEDAHHIVSLDALEKQPITLPTNAKTAYMDNDTEYYYY